MITNQRKAEFRILLDNAPIYQPPEPVLEPDVYMLKDDRPSTVAQAFEDNSKVPHHYNSIDHFSIYSNDQYQQIEDEEELHIYIRRFILKCRVKKNKKDSNNYDEPIKKESDGYIRDIKKALAAQPSVHLKPKYKAPTSFDSALNPKTTIALKNGLLDIRESGKFIIKPFTPNFYTFNYLPVNFDPDITAEVMTKLTNYYFTEDDLETPDLIAADVLYSWMKRWLRRIMTPHKICALTGSRRSGKSTIGRITSAFLGPLNVASLTISQLAYTHGLYSLMNRQLGVMWDASVTGRQGDVAKAVEVLKNISGQDFISINPKGKDIIDLEDGIKLNILMIANKIADLKDDTGALASRFTFLKTTQSFMGHEDPTMEDYVIKHELPGILNLVLKAPDTIIEHPKSESIREEFTEMSSPYTAFVKDCCSLNNPNAIIPASYLWGYYCDWAKKCKQNDVKLQTFKPEFIAAVEAPYGVKKIKPRFGDDDVLALEDEHKVSHKAVPLPKISKRPLCYQGIEILENLKGEWYDPRANPGASLVDDKWSY